MLKILPLLLILPIIAVVKSFALIDWQITVTYLVILSLLTYAIYWHDKRRAESSGWRVPERILHLFELLGGWPAAFVAQQILRHKSSKRHYRIVFWLIVSVHQFIALDYILGWRIIGGLTG